MDRRQFLKTLSKAGILILTSADLVQAMAESSPEFEALVIGNGRKEKVTDGFAAPMPSKVLFIQLKKSRVKEVAISFSPHLTIQNPADPNHFYAIQKWGNLIADINVQTEQIRYITLPANQKFYGHGV